MIIIYTWSRADAGMECVEKKTGSWMSKIINRQMTGSSSSISVIIEKEKCNLRGPRIKKKCSELLGYRLCVSKLRCVYSYFIPRKFSNRY